MSCDQACELEKNFLSLLKKNLKIKISSERNSFLVIKPFKLLHKRNIVIFLFAMSTGSKEIT